MTGRDPIFGQAVRPYAGGTGHSQEGPSRDRQEREDASGLSAARQTLVLGYLDREGPLGMTIRQLAGLTGWHHGQTSNALSLLDKGGKIVRLDEQREGQSVYVLEKFVQGRIRARRRRSTEEKVREEVRAEMTALAEANQTLAGENEALREHVRKSDATVGVVNTRLTEAGIKVAELQEAVTRLTREAHMWEETARTTNDQVRSLSSQLTATREAAEAWQRASDRWEAAAAEAANRLTQMDVAHRAEKSLRMTLEEDESAVVLRTGDTLGKPSVQVLGDDEQVKVTLGVLRMFMRILGRSTKFTPEAD